MSDRHIKCPKCGYLAPHGLVTFGAWLYACLPCALIHLAKGGR